MRSTLLAVERAHERVELVDGDVKAALGALVLVAYERLRERLQRPTGWTLVVFEFMPVHQFLVG